MKEINFYSRKTRLVVLILAIFFVVMAIITGILWPDAKFDWFFGDIVYWGGCTLLTIILLILWTVTGGEHRESHLYLTPDGDLDFSSPRNYTRLQKSRIAQLLGANAWWTSLTLAQFEFENGKVRLQNSKGESIEGLLKELTVRRSFTKNKITGDFYPYKYIITDNEGNSLKFYVNNNIYEENEWDDIHMLLEQAGTLIEPKVSKFTRKADKIVSALGDLDLTDIPGAVIEVAFDTVTVKAQGLMSTMVKKKLSKKKGKDSKWIKILTAIKDWFILILLILYLLAVIVYNLIYFPAWNHPTNDYSGQEEEVSVYEDDANLDEDSEEKVIHLTGIIAGKYPIDMTLDLGNETGTYYYVKNGPGNTLSLHITALDDDGNIVIEEYNDNGEQTGVFEGRVMNDGKIDGWFTNYQGKEMTFSLQIDQQEDEGYSSNNSRNVSNASIKGFVIGANGKEYPFRITYDMENGRITNARYKNINYKAEANLPTARFEDDEYYFSGKIGGDNLQIRFSSKYPYKGTMAVGGNISEIRMEL